MIRALLLMTVLASPVLAAEWPDGLAREGECTVCALRGGEHGVERYTDWREYDGVQFGFCSEGCAEAFDQMPAGYAPPVLPRPAPGFDWIALDGTGITPLGSGPLLVDFWATWCAPCIAAIPEFEEIAGEFADHGLRVVGVSIDEKRKDLNAWLERRPVGYPIVHDGGEDPAWWAFRVPAIPAAFLLNAEGEIVAQWNGNVDPDAVRSEIEGLIGPD